MTPEQNPSSPSRSLPQPSSKRTVLRSALVVGIAATAITVLISIAVGGREPPAPAPGQHVSARSTFAGQEHGPAATAQPAGGTATSTAAARALPEKRTPTRAELDAAAKEEQLLKLRRDHARDQKRIAELERQTAQLHTRLQAESDRATTYARRLERYEPRQDLAAPQSLFEVLERYEQP